MPNNKNRAIAVATLTLLSQKFPAAFPVRSRQSHPLRPLKVGIHQDILETLPELDPKHLHHALATHCANPWYLNAIVAGAERIALDGSSTGAVIDAETAAHAVAKRQAQIDRRNARNIAVATAKAAVKAKAAPAAPKPLAKPPATKAPSPTARQAPAQAAPTGPLGTVTIDTRKLGAGLGNLREAARLRKLKEMTNG